MIERKTVVLEEVKCTGASVSPEIPANGQLNVTMTGVDVQDLLENLHMTLSPAELVNTFGLDYFLSHIGADEVLAWLEDNQDQLTDPTGWRE